MDIDTGLEFAPRAPGVSFEHCGVEHYRFVGGLEGVLDPAGMAMVCGVCPAPQTGLLLRCHVCGQPIRLARSADGRVYTSAGRRNGDA